MKMFKRIAFALAFAAMFSVVSAGDTAWPERATEYVAPVNPGGDTDINCRVFLKYMEKELGQSQVVVNMAGAGGSIGMINVMQARPNGYRAVFYHSGSLILKIMDFFDMTPTEAYEIAAIPVIDKSNCLVANVKAPYNNPKELIDYMKANPDDVSYATEVGSFTHLHALAIENLADVSFNIADVGTASQKITALLGGRVDIISTQYGLVKDYIRKGDFKCVGILTDKKLAGAEDEPLFKDYGYDLVFDKFFYVGFPKGTPREIIEKFNAAAKNVAENPDYIKDCQNNFVNANYFSIEDGIAYINGQFDNYMKYEDALTGE